MAKFIKVSLSVLERATARSHVLLNSELYGILFHDWFLRSYLCHVVTNVTAHCEIVALLAAATSPSYSSQ